MGGSPAEGNGVIVVPRVVEDVASARPEALHRWVGVLTPTDLLEPTDP